MIKILVVDEEPELLIQLKLAADGKDRDVTTASSTAEAIRLIGKEDFDVVVTDLRMELPYGGLEVLKASKEKDLYIQVIVVTYRGTPEISVEAMRLGAFDYIERDAPNTNVVNMIRKKIDLAKEFREAKLIWKSEP